MSPIVFVKKFCVGLSCGTSFPLTIVILDYWLKECGVSNSVIGFFTFLHLPFTLKFIWAPLIDDTDIPYLSKLLGRTKSWVILSQMLLMIGVIGMAHADPGSSLDKLMFFVSMTSFADGCQNVALYPYQIDRISEKEFGYTASIVGFGYAWGSVLTKFTTLQVAHFYGWTVAYECAAGLIFICMVSILATPSPQTSCDAADDAGDAGMGRLKYSMRKFCDTKDGRYLLALLMLYKAADHMIHKMSRPFCLDIGFSKEEIATIAQLVGAASTVIGGFIGGLYVKKMKLKKSMMLLGVAHMLSLYSYVGLWIYGHNTHVLGIVACLEGVTGGATAAAFLAFLYTLCPGSSQYALLWALHEFAGLVLASVSGICVDFLGWLRYFILIPLVFTPSLLLLRALPEIDMEFRIRNGGPKQTKKN
ncbi:MAG: hypothetical protein LBJ16_02770 [Holosporaceae bacterium]|jgi:PAT family beta-lactamase induction signal transducer AmpG|nr:hypothetical protein [Holosporaceae bacterium]